MSFALSGSIITQSGDDLDLSGLITADIGVTKTYPGIIPMYTLPAGVGIVVNGTMTINPEENILYGDAAVLIRVQTGGTLNTGVELTSVVDGSVRPTRLVAIYNQRAQFVWWGGGAAAGAGGVIFTGGAATVAVNSGGTWVSKGCIIVSPGIFGNATGSTIWLKDLEWHCHDVVRGVDIDPTTGNIAATNVGMNLGQTNANYVLKDVGRGYVGWQGATDVRWDNVIIVAGGEIDFYKTPDAGNNSESGTPCGYFGYKALDMKSVILVDAQAITAPNFLNLDISGAGNLKEFTLQSLFDANHEGYATDNKSGSLISMLGAQSLKDRRNWGYMQSISQVNFNVVDADTGLTVSDGRVFMRDTDNGERKNTSSTPSGTTYVLDDTSDLTYSNTFTSGSLADNFTVVRKIINVQWLTNSTGLNGHLGGTSNNPAGTDRSSDAAFVDSTTISIDGDDVAVGDRIRFLVTTTGGALATYTIIATAAQKNFTVTSVNATDTIVCQQVDAQNILWISDLRGNTNVEGVDEFDFHLWRYENEYVSLVNTALNNADATGITEVGARVGADKSITNTRATIDALNTSIGSGFVVANTSLTTTSTAVNLDQIYDLVKYKKEDTAAGLETPTSSTMILESDGSILDLGVITLNVGTGKWTVGANHKTVKRTTTFDASNIVQHADLIIDSPQLTNIPTVIKGRLNTGAGNISTSGGKTLDITSYVDGLTGGWTFTTAGNTFNGIFNPDFSITSTGINTFNNTISGDVSIAGGNQTFGLSFAGEGGWTANGNGDWTFDSNSDVSAMDIDAASGITINIYGKEEADFDDIGTTGTILFPSDPTRLDINIGTLDNETPYSVYQGSTKIATGTSVSGTNLEYSNQSSDGTRQHISSIAGDWSVAIVDSNKRCTFRGLTVTTAVPETFTMAMPSFDAAFEVAAATLGSRTCTVNATDNVGRVQFDIQGCAEYDYADEAMTSKLFAGARKSVNYIESMRRKLIADSVTIPVDGSSTTYDSVRPVLKGADLRNTTYYLNDTETGSQLLDGLRDVLDLPDFSSGTKSERELRMLATNLESDGVTHRVKTSTRDVVSSAEIASATKEELSGWGNSLSTGLEQMDESLAEGIESALTRL